jgi:hypothetical protein
MEAQSSKRITVTVNGEEIEYDVEARRLLGHLAAALIASTMFT